MIKRQFGTDIASQHRAAGMFALAFVAAAITALAGVFAIDAGALRLHAVFPLDLLPDALWPTHWLAGAVSAAEQQQAAADQWLRIVLLFAALTATVAGVNAWVGFAAHANERRYESALRGMVGASPAQLKRALLRDALVNTIAGAGLGVVAGALVALALRRMWRAQGAPDAGWAVFAVALCLAIAAIAAYLAGRRFGRRGWLGDALAPEARSVPGFGAEDLRALLTGAQLACAVALTIVSALVWSYASARPLAAAGQQDRYVASGIVTGSVTPERIRAQLRAAGVQAESIATPGALLGIGKVDKIVSLCGQCSRGNLYTPMFAVETQQHVVGSGFFRVAGIRIENGREFADDAHDARSVVVNRTFARQAFLAQDPIGKRILVGGAEHGVWYDVIGVSDDVPTRGLRHLSYNPADPAAGSELAAPAIYFSADAHPPSTFDVIVQSATRPVALAGLGFQPLAQVFERANTPQRSFARVLAVLGLMLCAAAAIGTFSATMLSVRARRIEIAIRRSVGARRIDVERLVFARVCTIALKGIAAGVIVSVPLARAFEAFVPGLPLLDWRVVVLVTLAFFISALIAAVPPLRTALRISPARAHD